MIEALLIGEVGGMGNRSASDSLRFRLRRSDSGTGGWVVCEVSVESSALFLFLENLEGDPGWRSFVLDVSI